MEELLTVKETAKLLKTSQAFVRELKRAGLLKFMKLGSLKIRRSQVDEFLKKYEGYDLSDPYNPIKGA